MSQELRNKIYGVAGSIGAIAVLLGLVTQTDTTTALGLVDQVLTTVGMIVTLATTIFAFVKSMPSRVTVIDVPKVAVAEITVTTTNGEVLTPQV